MGATPLVSPYRLEQLRHRLTAPLESVGFSHTRSPGCTAVTLAEGRGLSTSGLVESLDLSRASIRNAARFLEGTGIGERYRVPDSREAHYRMVEGV